MTSTSPSAPLPPSLPPSQPKPLTWIKGSKSKDKTGTRRREIFEFFLSMAFVVPKDRLPSLSSLSIPPSLSSLPYQVSPRIYPFRLSPTYTYRSFTSHPPFRIPFPLPPNVSLSIPLDPELCREKGGREGKGRMSQGLSKNKEEKIGRRRGGQQSLKKKQRAINVFPSHIT